MELKWLDDYIALIDTGSFSAAAQRRHVSQPAFSRRIQMLEAWLGVTLIDRSRKPLRLTQVAAEHQAAFRSLVARVYEFRALLNSAALDSAVITIAAQHTLAAAYLPAVLARGQGGLLDLALDPGFSANRTLFFCFAEDAAVAHMQALKTQLPGLLFGALRSSTDGSLCFRTFYEGSTELYGALLLVLRVCS